MSARVRWVPDEERTHCADCGKKFTLMRRKVYLQQQERWRECGGERGREGRGRGRGWRVRGSERE